MAMTCKAWFLPLSFFKGEQGDYNEVLPRPVLKLTHFLIRVIS